MKKFKLEPRDCIAFAVIIGGMILIGLGKDSAITAILTGISGFYFGLRINVK